MEWDVWVRVVRASNRSALCTPDVGNVGKFPVAYVVDTEKYSKEEIDAMIAVRGTKRGPRPLAAAAVSFRLLRLRFRRQAGAKLFFFFFFHSFYPPLFAPRSKRRRMKRRFFPPRPRAAARRMPATPLAAYVMTLSRPPSRLPCHVGLTFTTIFPHPCRPTPLRLQSQREGCCRKLMRQVHCVLQRATVLLLFASVASHPFPRLPRGPHSVCSVGL